MKTVSPRKRSRMPPCTVRVAPLCNEKGETTSVSPPVVSPHFLALNESNSRFYASPIRAAQNGSYLETKALMASQDTIPFAIATFR